MLEHFDKSIHEILVGCFFRLLIPSKRDSAKPESALAFHSDKGSGRFWCDLRGSKLTEFSHICNSCWIVINHESRSLIKWSTRFLEAALSALHIVSHNVSLEVKDNIVRCFNWAYSHMLYRSNWVSKIQRSITRNQAFLPSFVASINAIYADGISWRLLLLERK